MRYVAFLRAVNVGGRVVKMDELRRLFTSMGHSGVETFIASGNVIFDSPARTVTTLERSIEKSLQQALGYPVATLIRSLPELAALAAHPLVSGRKVPDGATVYVAFLRGEPSREAAKTLLSFANAIDQFHVQKREVLWVLQRAFSESTFTGARLEKTLGMPATVRNSTTVRKIVEKFGTE